jgi:hypothetical protein
MAILAVLAEPKNPDGQLCDPWGQLMTMAYGTASANSVALAIQAWAPWNGNGWSLQALGAGDSGGALVALRRAYALTPFDGSVASGLADRLLMAGDREGARSIALEVRSGGHPVHELVSALLLLRVEASEARFGSALAGARRALVPSSKDAGWVLAQRFEVAWRAFELADLLGRAGELADVLYARFLEPEPPLLDGSIPAVSQRVSAICALASAPVSARCFERFQALRGRLSGGITPDTDSLLRGAERWARRDLAGAAKAWRPLLGGPGALASVLPGAMAEAFERAGDVELAERVDAAEMLRAGEFNGATLGHVRAARRALARRDRGKARALAEKVIAAWSVSDEEVPAVAEMRRLLAGLEKG